MNIKFIKSSSSKEEYPFNIELNEYAFVGRSNVGKSSLINFLSRNNKIAKVSSSPGKTKTINHFIVNNEYYLVDLPGYGYVKPLIIKNKLKNIISEYIVYRKNLICLFILIDVCLPPQNIDIKFIKSLLHINIKFSLIFNKIDKININKCKENILYYKNNILKKSNRDIKFFKTSFLKNYGRTDILEYINYLNINTGK